MSRKRSRIKSRNKSRTNRKSPLAGLRAGLLAAGMGIPVLAGAQSKPYPTYVAGPQPNGSWVVSSGQVIIPAGTQVSLGIRVRKGEGHRAGTRPRWAHHCRRPHPGYVGDRWQRERWRCLTTRTGVVLQKLHPVQRNGSERQL